MNATLHLAVAQLKRLADNEAIALLSTSTASPDSATAALSFMLLYSLYAGDQKDWRRADEALRQACVLNPEYLHYNEECDLLERGQPPKYVSCREFATIVMEIYAERLRPHRERGPA